MVCELSTPSPEDGNMAHDLRTKMDGNGGVVSWAVMDKSLCSQTHLSGFTGFIFNNEGYNKKTCAGIHPHAWLILYRGSVLCKTNLKWQPTFCRLAIAPHLQGWPQHTWGRRWSLLCPVPSFSTLLQLSFLFHHLLRPTKEALQPCSSRSSFSASVYLILTGGLIRKQIKIFF